jgi:hypothetical protein
LNHCLTSSTSDTSAIGALQMRAVAAVISSKVASDPVSRTWKLHRAARRSASVHDGEPLSGEGVDIKEQPENYPEYSAPENMGLPV